METPRKFISVDGQMGGGGVVMGERTVFCS